MAWDSCGAAATSATIGLTWHASWVGDLPVSMPPSLLPVMPQSRFVAYLSLSIHHKHTCAMYHPSHTRFCCAASNAPGSKWTAASESDVLGWRHFTCVQQRRIGKLVFVLMQASCDPAAQIWLAVQLLKNRNLWAAGWLQMSEMVGAAETPTGKICQSCSGTAFKVCVTCRGTGQAMIKL